MCNENTAIKAILQSSLLHCEVFLPIESHWITMACSSTFVHSAGHQRHRGAASRRDTGRGASALLSSGTSSRSACKAGAKDSADPGPHHPALISAPSHGAHTQRIPGSQTAPQRCLGLEHAYTPIIRAAHHSFQIRGLHSQQGHHRGAHLPGHCSL